MKVQNERQPPGYVPKAEGMTEREKKPGGPSGVGGARGAQPLARAATFLFCGVFFLLIWMPALDVIFGLDHSPMPIENRPPAKFPVFGGGLDGLKSYVAGLEAYFNDHFGFRKFFIRAHGGLERRLFGQGSPEVLIGREQWLFYAGNGALDWHMGTKLLSPKQLRDWRVLIEKRRDWLTKHGIKYLFVIPPNKETIYPEYLPEWAYRAGASTGLDQLLSYLRTNSTVEILDLRPALLEARKRERIYLKTDTHWNQLGAFAGCQEIVRRLTTHLPGLPPPLQRDDFEAAYAPRPGGDLARMLAQEQALQEPDFVTLSPRSGLPKLEPKRDVSLLPKNWAPNEEPLFIDNPAHEFKAMMFRDSFSEYLTPFLGYHFKRIVFIWQREWDYGLIEREQPHVVIDEMLERYLDWPLAKH